MSDDLLRYAVTDGVATLTMNNPKRLNGWTLTMQEALNAALRRAAEDDAVGALVLTGTGEYYSAGADLSGSLRLDHPKKLRRMIVEKNYALFDQFISFPKPILAAVNGRAIGAPVTSCATFDGVIAATRASFLTPFAKLGVPAEGGSSIQFARLMGEQNAERMLGAEGFEPTAEQALEMGLVTEVVEDDALLEAAQARAAAWARQKKPRAFRGGTTKDELVRANRRESEEVADAFLSAPFLMGQFRYLKSRKKTGPALTFLALRLTRPAWSRLL